MRAAAQRKGCVSLQSPTLQSTYLFISLSGSVVPCQKYNFGHIYSISLLCKSDKFVQVSLKMVFTEWTSDMMRRCPYEHNAQTPIPKWFSVCRTAETEDRVESAAFWYRIRSIM